MSSSPKTSPRNGKPKIAFFSTKSYDKEYFTEFNKKFDYSFTFFEARLNEQTAKLALGHDVVCVFVNDVCNARVLTELQKGGVRLIALRCAGFNNVDLEKAKELNITVLRVPAYSPYAVAEHAVALILTLNRHTHKAYNKVREGNFALDGLLGFDLNGKTVGVIGTGIILTVSLDRTSISLYISLPEFVSSPRDGFNGILMTSAGKIGAILCKILKHGFNMNVIAYDVFQSKEVLEMGIKYVTLDEVYGQSDIISLHVPLLPATHHMINKEALSKMKNGVMIINTSRGPLIDTDAVIEALKSRKIGYLGLDVYEEEGDLFFEDLSAQVIQDDRLMRLCTFPNVVITGHQAFFTRTALEQISTVTLTNVADFVKGSINKQNEVTVQAVAKPPAAASSAPRAKN